MRKYFCFGFLFFCFSCFKTPVSFKLKNTDNPFFIGCFLTPDQPMNLYFYPIETSLTIQNNFSVLQGATVKITRKSDGLVQNLTFDNGSYQNTTTDFVLAAETYFLELQYQNYIFTAETTVPDQTVDITYEKGIVQPELNSNYFAFKPYFLFRTSSAEKQYFYLYGNYFYNYITNPGTSFEQLNEATFHKLVINNGIDPKDLLQHFFTNVKNNKPEQNFTVDRFKILSFQNSPFFDIGFNYAYQLYLLIVDEHYYEYHLSLRSITQSFDELAFNNGVSSYTNIEGGFGVFGSYLSKNYTLTATENPSIYQDVADALGLK